MSFVAEGSRVVRATPEEAFDRLASHATWPKWMPATFRPLDEHPAVLGVGVRIRVRLARTPVPTPITVSVAERARELTWCGGVRGVLFAEHRFLFEPHGEGRTLVRSVETWSGALAGAVRPVLKPLAERIAGDQLEALANALSEG